MPKENPIRPVLLTIKVRDIEPHENSNWLANKRLNLLIVVVITIYFYFEQLHELNLIVRILSAVCQFCNIFCNTAEICQLTIKFLCNIFHWYSTFRSTCLLYKLIYS